MTAVRRVVAAGCAAVSLAAPAQAGATPIVRTSPPLQPGFTNSIPDYTVRCAAKRQLRLSISQRPGTTSAVDSHYERRGDYRVTVPLVPGRQVEVRISTQYRSRTYHVRCVPPDFPRWTTERSARPEAAWFIVAPIHIGALAPGYAIVIDGHGVPVWWMRDPGGGPLNPTLLPDGGIAWLTSHGTPFGMDDEAFAEHALDGRITRRFSAVGDPTDHHELEVLPNHDAMVIAYRPRDHVDLTSMRSDKPSDATVLDGEVQEIDSQGRLKWSWSTKDHVAVSESSRWGSLEPNRLRDGRDAYDIVHMNSVDVQGGRVVVSMRHTDAVYEIDKATGAVVWKLGGTTTPQSLTIVGDPFGAEAFGGQHDARLSPDGRTLTLYDNGTLRDRPSRALRYSIDTKSRTATLIQSVTDGNSSTFCCGSTRLLPGGHWVTGWGDRPLVTEADAAGTRIFAIEFADARATYRVDPVLPGLLSRNDLRRGMDAMAPR